MAKKILARIDTSTGNLTDFTSNVLNGFDGITVNDTVLFVVQFKESLTATQTDLDLTGALSLRVTIRSARNPSAQLWSFQDSYNQGDYPTNEDLSKGYVTWLVSMADPDLVSALGELTSVGGFIEFTWLDPNNQPQTLGTFPITVFNEVDNGAAGSPPPTSPTYLTATEIADDYLKKELGNWTQAAEKTIASGAITITQSTIRIDTEADAAADNLDTINFTPETGSEFQLMLVLEDASRVVTLTNAGNILTPDGSNYTLDAGVVYLNYDNQDSKWRMNNASNTGGGTVTSVDVAGGTTGLGSTGGPITGSGTITLNGTLVIANGGTGQTAKLGAFNALSPNVNKGDVTAHNGTNNIKLAVGANLTRLEADSTEATGLKWVTNKLDDLANATITAVAQGEVLYYNGTDWVNLGVGTSGQFLKTNGAAANPSWGTGVAGGWTVTKITATGTASNDDDLLTDTTGGIFTYNLPLTPANGDRVRFRDISGTWDTNNLTVGRNAQTIRGAAADFVCDVEFSWIEFTYNGTDSDWEYFTG